MPVRLLLGAAALALLVACTTGSAPTGASSRPQARRSGEPPCEHAQPLVVQPGRGLSNRVVQTFGITLGRTLRPSVCDFTGYAGSPGVASAVDRAATSRSAADAHAARERITERIATVQTDPSSCVSRRTYPCTTELAWLSTQAKRIPGSGGATPVAGGLGGSLVDSAADAAAETFSTEVAQGIPAEDLPSDALANAAANAQAVGKDAKPYLDGARNAAAQELADLVRRRGNCTGTAEDLRAIMQAAGRVQSLDGDAGAVTTAIASLQGLVKAVARGELAGGSLSEPTKVAAEVTGIDTSKNDWTADPNCLERWTLSVTHESHMEAHAQDGVFEIVERWTGEVRLEFPRGLPEIKATAQGRYDGNARSDVCVWQGASNAMPIEVNLSNFPEGQLAGNVIIRGGEGTGTGECAGCPYCSGSGQIPIPGATPDELKIPLQSGATYAPPDPTPRLPSTGAGSVQLGHQTTYRLTKN